MNSPTYLLLFLKSILPLTDIYFVLVLSRNHIHLNAFNNVKKLGVLTGIATKLKSDSLPLISVRHIAKDRFNIQAILITSLSTQFVFKKTIVEMC